MKRTFDSLADALVGHFESGDCSEADFGALALEVFEVQFMRSPVYRSYCEGRGATPASVASWEEVPAVPATAFKYFDFSDPTAPPAPIVFETSGTTRGGEARGRHPVPRPDVYRASLAAPFRAALLPDVDGLAFLSLIPPPAEAPSSSLSFMVGAAAERFATDVAWLVDGQGRWREGLVELFAAAAGRDAPVLVLGTATAFSSLTEQAGSLAPLPPGSRAMETGGFKGVGREISRVDLHAAITRATGIPGERIVSEYGMTELLSQLYEPVLREGPSASGLHDPPPWLRVRALDPTSLEPLAEGESGLLAFFDLANVGSVSHVLTEDVGSIEGGSVRLQGRAEGAEPRGCSRAMDELMRVAAPS